MTIVALGLFISMISGIILTVIAITKFENYFHPYLFALLFSTAAIIVGYFFSSRIKTFVLRTNKNIIDYSLTRLYVISGFIGVFLMGGVLLNNSISTLDLEATPIVLYKTTKESRYRNPGYNKLHFEVNGKVESVRCHKDYWDYISQGQRINIEIYKSKIGFDYISLPNE